MHLVRVAHPLAVEHVETRVPPPREVLVALVDHLVAGVREVVYARSIPPSTEHLTIAPSRAAGNVAGNAAILGAAQLAIDAALSPERIAAALGG